MKRICDHLRLLILLLSCATPIAAQTNNRSDQALNDLLNEVRLLRQDIRQLTTVTYRAQTMIARLKLQQEQVNRVNLELDTVRTQLQRTRSARSEFQQRMAAMQKSVDAGTTPPDDVSALKATLSDLEQQEPDLVTRESQLSGQLNYERSNLEELQKKLDSIEGELQSLGEDNPRPKRNQ